VAAAALQHHQARTATPELVRDLIHCCRFSFDRTKDLKRALDRKGDLKKALVLKTC
jgi:hypothetical protein